MSKKISIIIPVYNEEKNVPQLYAELAKVIATLSDRYVFEFIFVNDGSCDKSLAAIEKLAKDDQRVRVIDFSRNFGKEAATSAGCHESTGDAAIMIDADLQHPVEQIPEFIKCWEKGAEVVVGVRSKNKGEGLTKKIGSRLFYKIINAISELKIIPGSTDFRLIDRMPLDEFNQLEEKSRMTRALIDWIGFRREYVYFEAKERMHGEASYSFFKLLRLAFNSMISLSLFPLKLGGYLGIVITFFSGGLGLYIIISEFILHTNYFTWPAILAVMNVFLIGIVLICLGFIALYIANIHNEVNNRPMYIIRKKRQATS